MNWILTSIIGYILLQLFVCLAVMRRMRSEQDYLLAGRRLGVPMIAMTIFATWFGAEACVGAAGIIYDQGMSGSRADPFGYALCIFILGFFFARQLWRRNLMTIADFYRQRFGGQVDKLGVLLQVPLSVIWAAGQILAFGYVLTSVSELDMDIAIALAATVVILYTTLGGFLADVVSDMLQGVVLIIGLTILFVLVILNLPEPDLVREALSPQRLSLRAEGESWLSIINGWSIPFIGSLFAAELVTRVLASGSETVARRGAMIGGSIYLLVGLMPAILGLLGPAYLPGLEDGEQLLPLLAERFLPTAFYIVFVGALVSAILSTVDSALLNAGALVSHNIIVPMTGTSDEGRKVLYARLCVVVFGLIAWQLAREAESVYSLVEQSSAFGTAGVFTCCVMGLVQKRGGPFTATCSMVMGMVVYGVLEYVVRYDYAFLMSLVGSMLTFLMLMWFEQHEDSYQPGAAVTA